MPHKYGRHIKPLQGPLGGHAHLEAEGRDSDAFAIYANAGIAITAKAGAEPWKFTAPNGAVSVEEGEVLANRLLHFERMGILHLRIDFQAETLAGRLDLMCRVAEQILPALR